MDLKEEISRAVKNAGLCGKKILAALSGGVDSATMTRLLASSGEVGVEVAHVDHNLRPDSGEDARFCEELARELGCPFHLLTLSAADFPRGQNKQARARSIRRAFLEKMAKERGLSAIALAHHADDQAETVLFRLLRGSGPRGVCGMSPWEQPYFRPLLAATRADIEAAALAGGWAHREDPTNKTARYARNRVRSELLPLAREICPGADGALVRFSRLARLDEEYLTEEALSRYRALAVGEPEGVKFPLKELSALAPPLRYRIYLAAFRALGGDTGVLDSGHLDEIDSLLSSQKSFSIASAPGPLRFVKSYGWLWVLPDSALKGGEAFVEPVLSAEKESETAGEGAVLISLPEGRPSGEVLFRRWLPGDRLGDEKIKDILMEAGVERWRRKDAVVAEDGGGILALVAPLNPPRAWALGADVNREGWLIVNLAAGWWKLQKN